MDEKKLTELMKDKVFVEKMLAAPTQEEAKKLFKEHDMELTDDEMKFIDKIIIKTVQNNGKLSDEDLENVSGGVVDASGIAIGVAVTLAVQVAVVALGAYAAKKFAEHCLKNARFNF